MANPNIVSVASIYGKTACDTDVATSAASLVLVLRVALSAGAAADVVLAC